MSAPSPLFSITPLDKYLYHCSLTAKENQRPRQQQQQQFSAGGSASLGQLLLAGATCLTVGLIHKVQRHRKELKDRDCQLRVKEGGCPSQ